ncbi:RNI-like protein [Wallemia mellicola]|uniref:RNI-like protein n=1 Tax=Wallemia mellicola TaxID=1708541 RepID=A0AB74KFG5_9BASI|nr:RNI-like protein [Wallemia mellicola]
MDTPGSPTPSNTSISSINDENDINFEAEILQSLALAEVTGAQMTPKGGARESIPLSIKTNDGLLDNLNNPNGPITTLPLEILIHILRLLNNPTHLLNALLVCRTWCACSIEILWHRPSFPAATPYVKFAHILGGLYPNTPTFHYSSYVRRLNFSNIHNWISDPYFLPVAKCNRLERLTLTGCKNLSDSSLEFVLESCKNVLALDLSGITKMSDKTLKVISKNCKKLQGMNLTDCDGVTDEGVSELARGCKHLRRLKLCNLRQLTDVTVVEIAQNCPDLLEVDFTKCSISSSSVSLFWKNGINTREFRLGQCAFIDDSAFPSPPPPTTTPYQYTLVSQPQVKHFEVLRHLDLTSCTSITDEAIKGIIAHAPKVRNLVLAKCSNLTDIAIKNISKLGKALHSLHLGHVTSITDESIIVLARMCTRIRYIDLACCPNLTDNSITELARNMPKLKRIGLVRVTNLTDVSIYALCDTYTQLERIHLSYCEKITVNAVHFLISRLQKLTHLSLSGIPDFRRPDLQRFCRAPPKEFSEHQRQVFCVFSGKGIHDLRAYMQEEYARVRRGDILFEELPPFHNSSNGGSDTNLPSISSILRPRPNRLFDVLGLSNSNSQQTSSDADVRQLGLHSLEMQQQDYFDR